MLTPISYFKNFFSPINPKQVYNHCFFMREIFLVLIVLIALAALGSVLILGILELIPFIAALILGGICALILLGLILVGKHYRTIDVIIDDNLLLWAKIFSINQKAISMDLIASADLKKAKEAAKARLARIVRECKSQILKGIYIRNKEILEIHTFLLKCDHRTNYKRLVATSYYLLKKIEEKFPEFIKELYSNLLRGRIKEKNGKIHKLPQDKTSYDFHNNLATFCLAYSNNYDGHLSSVFKIIRTLVVNYIGLREVSKDTKFFSSESNYYSLRCIFNDCVKLVQGLFNLDLLKVMYEEGRYHPSQEQNILTALMFAEMWDQDKLDLIVLSLKRASFKNMDYICGECVNYE
ncbi:hypothetical protein [Candidatus Chlamydia sanziniae]|uniref:Uncharacterized protein n=1 Tax=Candidatus Chlamydia sanziniae TaxID=1806891 RepID=A0A1A9HY59_9CHLA|nr:hypothetical protein [Candidatus Chlamydia sanziniae]ANH78974.1 hypothetical protein Cs308_0804 [Candidatus Chlamydia sanziniae]